MASSFHLTPFIFSLHGRRRVSSINHFCIHGSSSTSAYGHLSMSTSTKASNGPPQHMETEKERDMEKKQKQKKKKKKKENLQPSISLEMGEDCNEDPLGRKELDKAVILSLAESVSAMASELVVAEDKGELSDLDKRVVGTGLVVQKQKQKQNQKQKQKKKKEEEDQNLQSSISIEMGEDRKEDPIGRKELGKAVIPSLAKSMSAMASELAESEEKGELSNSDKRVVGIVRTGLVVQKQKNKKKNKKEENIQSSISLEKGEDCKGDPMGRKELGKAVIPWLAEGMSAMASELVEAEEKGELADSDKRVIGIVGTGLVVQAQPFLSKGEIPPGYEEQCMKASTHYPTLFDHFQRELRKALMASEQKGGLVDWQNSLSWRSLKKLDGHRVVPRKLPENMQLHEQLGVARYRITEIQGKIDAFVDHALQLLQSERDAETEATQMGLNASPKPKPALNDGKVTEYSENDNDEASHQEHCDAICNLQAISSSTGLGRLHLVTFRVRGGHRLPLTNISPGDMVCIRVVDHRGSWTAQRMQGLVHTFGEDGASITLSLEARFGHMIFSKLIGKTFRIDRVYSLADPTTYERNVEALKRLQNRGLRKGSPAAAVVATLFGEGPDIVWLAQHNPLIGETTISTAAPTTAATTTTTTSSDGNEVQDISTEGFDESQVRAIELGLRKDHPVMLIQGPPGTGKTKVVVKLIFEAVTRGTRVLATAPTNAAVDVLVERLGALGLDVVRIGNPARLAPSVASKSLGAIVDSKISGFRREIARRRSDLRADLRQCLEDDDLATGIRQLIKQLTRSLKEKEKNAIDETMASAQVVLATNIGSGEPLIQSLPPFDLAVIDEAGQAIEPSCWIPLLRCHRAILSGDPCQLAPTILSRQALEGGLGISLMERAGSLHGGVLQTLLCMQYRMHDAIAQWSSKQMYGGLVTSSPSVALHSLADSPDVKATVITETPLLLLDTRRSLGSLLPGCEECFDPAGTGSFFNEGEADIVVAHVQALISCGVVASSIAVQSPYVSQVELLQNKIQEISEAKGIQVATIDSFQGREADAVIISLVRSNEMGAIGFLGDHRRLNVAVTRARKHVAIVCDSSTVSRNAFLLHLLQHVRDFGVVNTAGSIPPRPKQSLIASSK